MNDGKADETSSDILGHNDTLHGLQRSPRAFLHLSIHAPTNASRRGACTTSAAAAAPTITTTTGLNKMPERALDPSRAELPCAPRELDDRSQCSAARFRGRIDERSSHGSEQLFVREDERLSLCVTIRQIRERKRRLENDV